MEKAKEEKQKECLAETKELSETEKLKKELSDLSAKLTEKEAQIEEQKNKLLRALADFDNFRKRAVIEREEIITFANENLILGLLPIIDNFERAIESSKKININEDLIKGIALIKRQIEDLLSKAGVMHIECLGKPFDPNFHEAILQKEGDKPEGEVLEEIQKGYTLHGKVIRSSMVIISSRQVGTGKKGAN